MTNSEASWGSPAGTLEKLQGCCALMVRMPSLVDELMGFVAVGNFTFGKWKKGPIYGRNDAKIYVAANMVMHEVVEDWWDGSVAYGIGIAAVIVQTHQRLHRSDRGLAEIAYSTQLVRNETLSLERLGATRVVSARSSMEELAEIRKRTNVESEALCSQAIFPTLAVVHIQSYEYRMPTVSCSQSCRWKYDLYDMPFWPGIRVSRSEEFSMSAVDMSMIDHIPDHD